MSEHKLSASAVGAPATTRLAGDESLRVDAGPRTAFAIAEGRSAVGAPATTRLAGDESIRVDAGPRTAFAIVEGRRPVGAARDYPLGW
ncbi:MAG TPA: hypothetical protein VGA56_09955 [Opitutaceae bacterium]